MAERDGGRKGKVLYEEKKISNRAVLILFVLGQIGAFFFMIAMLQTSGGGLELSLWFGLLLVFILLVSMLPVVLVRRHPLVIYERGFDAPVPICKFLKARERFVPFSEVDKIHPEQAEIYGTTLPRGFTILTKKGRRIDIVEMIESKVRETERQLKLGLGDSWNSVYLDAPYVGFDELQKLEATLSRSVWSVYAESLGVIAFAILFNFVAWIGYSDFALFVVSTVVLVAAIMFGAMRIANYHSALGTYKRAVSADPSVKGMFGSMGIEVAYDDPLEMAERFTNADWRRLDRSVKDKRPFIILGIGFGVMAGGIVSASLRESLDLPYSLGPGLLFTGVAIAMSSLLFVRRMSKDSETLTNIVKEELKRGTRILPEWFEVKGGFGGPRIFRDPPRLTDREWGKLVSASRIRDEKQRVLFMVPLLIAMPVAILLLFALPVPGPIGFGILMAIVMPTMTHTFIAGRRMATLIAIEAYEEHSGKKVIPERYRSRIIKGFK